MKTCEVTVGSLIRSTIGAMLAGIAADRVQDKISFGGLAERIRFNAADAIIVGVELYLNRRHDSPGESTI